MNAAPDLDAALHQALAGVKSDDVNAFYDYFEDLKRHVRRYLGRRAKQMPGESAIAQSALWSLFCDAVVQRVPLSDVDDQGYPMLWPLLLRYIERHCDKWNKFYLAKKRRAATVSLNADVGEARPDPADYRGPDDEHVFEELCRGLESRLTPEEQQVFAGRLQGKTLAEIAREIGRSEGTVVNRLKKIQGHLQSTGTA